MTRTQTERVRQTLEANLNHIETIANSLEDQARTSLGGEAGGNLSNTPMHLGDLGSEVYQQELSATLLEAELGMRDEVLAALDRLERGIYGICDQCGKKIPASRLEALPHAGQCTPCAAKLQQSHTINLDAGRPRFGLGAAADDTDGQDDRHAAGNAGGGTAVGGLAGTNMGRGNPEDLDLDNITATGITDRQIDSDGEPMLTEVTRPKGKARTRRRKSS